MRDIVSPAAIVRAAEDLATLAAAINAEHGAAEADARQSLEHARRCGELLLQAKAKCGHGGWIPWVEKNVRCGPRQAQKYMLLASRWDELGDQAKTNRGSFLSIRQALKLLSDATGGDATGWSVFNMTPEHRQWSCQRFWDREAVYTYLLHLSGWPEADIAEFLGAPAEEVSLILNPRPPRRFHTPEEGAGQFDPEIETHFGLMVEHYVNRMLARILGGYDWQSGALAGWEEDEFADIRAEALGLGRHFASLCPEGKVDELFDTLVDLAEDVDLSVALDFCALFDARAALGIEPARPGLMAEISKHRELDRRPA
jgi:hypothetical protein